MFHFARSILRCFFVVASFSKSCGGSIAPTTPTRLKTVATRAISGVVATAPQQGARTLTPQFLTNLKTNGNAGVGRPSTRLLSRSPGQEAGGRSTHPLTKLVHDDFSRRNGYGSRNNNVPPTNEYARQQTAPGAQSRVGRKIPDHLSRRTDADRTRTGFCGKDDRRTRTESVVEVPQKMVVVPQKFEFLLYGVLPWSCSARHVVVPQSQEQSDASTYPAHKNRRAREERTVRSLRARRFLGNASNNPRYFSLSEQFAEELNERLYLELDPSSRLDNWREVWYTNSVLQVLQSPSPPLSFTDLLEDLCVGEWGFSAGDNDFDVAGEHRACVDTDTEEEPMMTITIIEDCSASKVWRANSNGNRDATSPEDILRAEIYYGGRHSSGGTGTLVPEPPSVSVAMARSCSEVSAGTAAGSRIAILLPVRNVVGVGRLLERAFAQKTTHPEEDQDAEKAASAKIRTFLPSQGGPRGSSGWREGTVDSSADGWLADPVREEVRPREPPVWAPQCRFRPLKIRPVSACAEYLSLLDV